MASIIFTPHSLPTRALHAGLAGAIVVQLASSQFMNPDGAGNTAFVVHQWSGLAAFGLVAASWGNSLMRQRGTPVVQLLPWFSGAGREAVWADIKRHWMAAKTRAFPAHGDTSALASAIHGLGLLLMTVMAASGTIYYLINTGDPDAGGLVGLTMLVHTSFANLVWAYLIGHAGMGLLAHFADHMSLGRMWSLRRNQG
jgi:cytochrome b561